METQDKTQPQVEAIAAFRWLANRIENTALECYMANPGLQQELAGTLLQTIEAIESMGAKAEAFGDCPPGWCPDAGRCMPCTDPR